MSKVSESFSKLFGILNKNLKLLIGIIIFLVAVSIAYLAFKVITTPKGDDQFSVTLTRGACFGSCPVYMVSIDGKGIVNYKGNNFVKVKGEHIYVVDVNNAIKLRDYLRKENFFSFKNRYEQNATDLPSFTLVVKDQGQTKQIYVYGSKQIDDTIPGVLFDMADAVDTAAEDKSFVVR